MISENLTFEKKINLRDEKICLLKEVKNICTKEVQFLREENKKLSEKVENLEEFFEKDNGGEEVEYEEEVKDEGDQAREKLGLVLDPEFKFERRSSSEGEKCSLSDIEECDFEKEHGITCIR